MAFRRGVLSLGLALVAVGLPGEIRAAESMVYPTAAGETIIHAEGLVGLTIEFPRETKWWVANVEVKVSDKTNYFGAHFERQGEDVDFCDFCFDTFASGVPESGIPPTIGECTNDPGQEVGCPIQKGLQDIYFTSDGEVTLKVRFPGLEGSTELWASGDLDGTLERLPMSCAPLPEECDRVTFGGVVRNVGLEGRGGYAVASAFVTSPGISPAVPPSPAEHKAVACAYPGYYHPNKSPDPSEYPQGCDFTDTSDNSSNFLIPSVNPNGGAWLWNSPSFKTHGPQYLGFTIRKVNTLEDGAFGAWGLWLNEGIDCPSSDFFDCHKD